MSDALDYLKKVRPEASNAYFEFLRKSSGQLDNKTRYLISIITKIDNQTEAGFKQYLKRALESGNSADDILDAILIAFPTLGLSKIIWAVNIILSMNLPEFQIEKFGSKLSWYQVCHVDALSDGVNFFLVNGMSIIVWKNKEKITVYSAKCPHQDTEMTIDDYAEGCMTCPKHQWKFDLATGDCIQNGNDSLSVLNHAVKNTQLEVEC